MRAAWSEESPEPRTDGWVTDWRSTARQPMTSSERPRAARRAEVERLHMRAQATQLSPQRGVECGPSPLPLILRLHSTCGRPLNRACGACDRRTPISGLAKRTIIDGLSLAEFVLETTEPALLGHERLPKQVRYHCATPRLIRAGEPHITPNATPNRRPKQGLQRTCSRQV